MRIQAIKVKERAEYKGLTKEGKTKIYPEIKTFNKKKQRIVMGEKIIFQKHFY
jgi:ASC-1-like (ASCH) protein